MKLIDQFLRKINYLRVSVTDRCDLRCVYCMKEKMNFLPKNEVLTLEEIESQVLKHNNWESIPQRIDWMVLPSLGQF